MHLYMIRHGQTDWNAELRMQGQKDIPLNATGRAQARQNGEALKALLGDQVYNYDFVASPLWRARETMQILRTAIGLKPEDFRIDERLREISFGDWEGHTLAELQAEWPDRLQARIENKWHFIPPGEDAESYEILSWRVGSFLKSLTRPTVCVSHGGIMRAALRLFGGYSETDAADTSIHQDKILEVETENPRAAWIN